MSIGLKTQKSMKNIDSEKALERMLRNAVTRELRGLCLKLQSIHFQGIPDRLCLLPGGEMFFVELKTTGFKLSEVQKRVHERLQALGFNVYTIDSKQLIRDLISKYERK